MSNPLAEFIPDVGGQGADCEMHVSPADADSTMGIQARRLPGSVLTGSGRPVLIGGGIWKFEMLKAPECPRAATAETASADLVVVSAHARGVLPAGVQMWLGEWVAARDGSSCALLAILAAAPASGGGALRMAAQLESWALRAGADFPVRQAAVPGFAGLDEGAALAEASGCRECTLQGEGHSGLNE